MNSNFWEPYRKATRKYLPAITNVLWVRRFRLGPYCTQVGTNCDSLGPIHYIHVMYVFKGNDELPCLAVSSEYTDQASSNSPFFCLFFGGAHFNMGSSPDFADLEFFTRKALEAIVEPLEIQSEHPEELS